MAIQKTEAFVLRTFPFRTSSLLATLFSKDFGKLKGIAKGVRKEGILRPSAFEPFTLLEIIFYEKVHSEIHLISETSILETHEGVRRDLSRLATAYYVAELTDQLTEIQDPHPSLFELLQFVFNYLPALPPSLLARFFEIRILSEIGFLPRLESCVNCGERNLEKVYFSVRQGTVLCLRCRQRSSDSRLLSAQALAAMKIFSGREPREVTHYSLPDETEKEMREMIERFLNERIGKPLSARRFLNQVQSLKLEASVHKA